MMSRDDLSLLSSPWALVYKGTSQYGETPPLLVLPDYEPSVMN